MLAQSHKVSEWKKALVWIVPHGNRQIRSNENKARRKANWQVQKVVRRLNEVARARWKGDERMTATAGEK